MKVHDIAADVTRSMVDEAVAALTDPLSLRNPNSADAMRKVIAVAFGKEYVVTDLMLVVATCAFHSHPQSSDGGALFNLRAAAERVLRAVLLLRDEPRVIVASAVLGNATLQTAAPLSEATEVVVYYSASSGYWLRPASEFNDGRFLQIGTGPVLPGTLFQHVKSGGTYEWICVSTLDLESPASDMSKFVVLEGVDGGLRFQRMPIRALGNWARRQQPDSRPEKRA